MSKQREEALRKEMDKLWSQFVAQCESIEDRVKPPIGEMTQREDAFYDGEKYAAKSIRRSVAHPKYNPADFPAYHGEA